MSRIAQSVRQRLLNLAHRRGDDFNVVLFRYGVERFLHRLGRSNWSDEYVLKGATLFEVWMARPYRATRDLDVSRDALPANRVAEQLARICVIDCPEDGLVFDSSPPVLVPIQGLQEGRGLRTRLVAHLGTARITFRLDIGFGDVITPDPVTREMPTLLDLPSPVVQTYPRETFVAEKFEAMVALGDRSTRMKDFADIAWISMHEAFDGPLLVQACRNTFEHRETSIDAREKPVILSPRFYTDRGRIDQWMSFATGSSLVHELGSLPEVGETLRRFLAPLWRAMTSRDERDRLRIGSWIPPGPWRSRRGGLDE